MSYQFRLVVSGGPTGDISSDWVYDENRISPGSGDPELTLTMVHRDFEKLTAGVVPAPVAYMQGLMKSVGNNALMLDFLARCSTPEFDDWIKRLSA